MAVKGKEPVDQQFLYDKADVVWKAARALALDKAGIDPNNVDMNSKDPQDVAVRTKMEDIDKKIAERHMADKQAISEIKNDDKAALKRADQRLDTSVAKVTAARHSFDKERAGKEYNQATALAKSDWMVDETAKFIASVGGLSGQQIGRVTDGLQAASEKAQKTNYLASPFITKSREEHEGEKMAAKEKKGGHQHVAAKRPDVKQKPQPTT